MSDILCMEDVPFQCGQCKSHFPTENSLKLHCFMEEHKMVSNQDANRNCTCGSDKKEPHQCPTCKLIGVSLDGQRTIKNAADQVYAKSQLWKCSGCGMLWKCIDCGVLFKGSNMFRQHMPHCQNVQETLKRMKSEKGSDVEATDMKGNIPVHVKEEKPDIKLKVKEEPSDTKAEWNADIKYLVKQEPVEDIKYPVKNEMNGNVKEKCDIDDKPFLKQEVHEISKGNRRKSSISCKRSYHGNHNLRERKK